jgi:hypothetical protein
MTTLLSAGIFIFCFSACAQEEVVWSDQEKPIVEQIRGLRKLDDRVRARTTKDLALQIRQLPVVPNKLRLAGALANLSTEGDFRRDTLQEVTTTLANAVRKQPPSRGKKGEPNDAYQELASPGAIRTHAGGVERSTVCRSNGWPASRGYETRECRFHSQ